MAAQVAMLIKAERLELRMSRLDGLAMTKIGVKVYPTPNFPPAAFCTSGWQPSKRHIADCNQDWHFPRGIPLAACTCGECHVGGEVSSAQAGNGKETALQCLNMQFILAATAQTRLNWLIPRKLSGILTS